MANKTITIRLTPPISAVLAENLSLTANLERVSSRYAHIMRAEMPSFTQDELQSIGNCLTGSYIEPSFVEYLHLEIQDSDDLTGETIQYPELVEKIKNLTIPQRYALLFKLGL